MGGGGRGDEKEKEKEEEEEEEEMFWVRDSLEAKDVRKVKKAVIVLQRLQVCAQALTPDEVAYLAQMVEMDDARVDGLGLEASFQALMATVSAAKVVVNDMLQDAVSRVAEKAGNMLLVGEGGSLQETLRVWGKRNAVDLGDALGKLGLTAAGKARAHANLLRGLWTRLLTKLEGSVELFETGVPSGQEGELEGEEENGPGHAALKDREKDKDAGQLAGQAWC